jgi:hypothetical protein
MLRFGNSHEVVLIRELLTALALVSHFLALHLLRTWLAASDSDPPITTATASSAAGAGRGPIDAERFDPKGGEMLTAAANRKEVRSSERLVPSAAGGGS